MISEQQEIELLISAIKKIYGYDFNMFSFEYIKKRLREYIDSIGIVHICELTPKILLNTDRFYQLLNFMTISYTEIYRDPELFSYIRSELLPRLKTYPHLKFWHVGCSKGAEPYSLAIMLFEEKLLEKSSIYATDLNHQVLGCARNAKFNMEEVKKGEENYKASGGKNDFYKYFSTEDQNTFIRSDIKNSVTFAHHNIASDSKFGTMNVIFIRNVLIYLQEPAQSTAIDTVTESLSSSGFIIVGNKESLRVPSAQQFYTQTSSPYVYQKNL